MKRFICKEIMNNEGGCDMVFEGDNAMDVASQCGKHIAGTSDEAHKPMRDMMTNSHSEEEKNTWWNWFSGEWERKGEGEE